MADNKTKPTKSSVSPFTNALTDQTKRADAKTLVKVMQRNCLNYRVFANPSQSLGHLAGWRALTTQGNTPSQMEFGIRFKF
jgi:hypothetical protein